MSTINVLSRCWREAVGTATSIYLTQEGVAGIIDRIINGLEALGIQPMDQPDATRVERIRKLLNQLHTRGAPEQAAMATDAIHVPVETTRPTEATTPALRKAPAKVKAPAVLKVRPSLFWAGVVLFTGGRSQVPVNSSFSYY